MTGVTGPIALLPRLLLIAPIVLIAVALVPALVFYPLLPDGPGRRVVALVEQLRAWHGEALERLARR
jgi:hypothetical protein